MFGGVRIRWSEQSGSATPKKIPVSGRQGEKREGRSVGSNFFWTKKVWPCLTTQYQPDVEQQCGTLISDFIVYTCSSCAAGRCGSEEALLTCATSWADPRTSGLQPVEAVASSVRSR